MCIKPGIVSKILWCVVIVVTIAAHPADAVTLRMVAVGVNGVKLDEPTSFIELTRGDRVETEIIISGWGGEIDEFTIWQVEMDETLMVIDDPPNHCGAIKPVHFDDPNPLRSIGAFMDARASPFLTGRGVCDESASNAGASCVNQPIECMPLCAGGTDHGDPCSTGCRDGGVCVETTCVEGVCYAEELTDTKTGLCDTTSNQCIGGSCINRPDFIMNSVTNLCLVDSSLGSGYRYGCVATELSTGVTDTGVDFYAGTMLLQVGPSAVGTFVLDFTPPSDRGTDTFFVDWYVGDVPAALVTLVPLEMVVLATTCDAIGACCDGANANPLASDGVCTDAVMPEDCQGDSQTWFEDTLCIDVNCEATFQAIPTVSEWGLVLLSITLMILAKVSFGRRANAHHY